MPVRFRDLTAGDEAGCAGFLKFEPEVRGGMRGALLVIDARGEPRDFTFTRVDLGAAFLWRAGDARRRAVAALTKALFSAVAEAPVLLLALAQEAPPQVFTEDIESAVPLVRVAEGAKAVQVGESPEALGESLQLFWATPPPMHDTAARRLLDTLSQRDLLLEPFERAGAGLAEAYRTGAA